MKNASLGVGRVEAVGPDEAVEEAGVKPGMLVVYDYYSAYWEDPEWALTRVENVVGEITEEEKGLLFRL